MNGDYRPNTEYERFRARRLEGEQLRVRLAIEIDKDKDLVVRWVHRENLVLVKKADNEFGFHIVDIEEWAVESMSLYGIPNE